MVAPLTHRFPPEGGESLGSWFDRLCARHSVTRAEMFRHLGLTATEAARDIDRNPGSRVLGRLVAATLVPRAVLVAAPANIARCFLLPPALRTFVCPHCWREAVAEGRPVTVRRIWLLRAVFVCFRHGCALVDMGDAARGGRAPSSEALTRHVRSAARLAWAARADECLGIALIKLRIVANGLLGGRHPSPRAPWPGYALRIAENDFHFSPARVPLLFAELRRSLDDPNMLRVPASLALTLFPHLQERRYPIAGGVDATRENVEIAWAAVSARHAAAVAAQASQAERDRRAMPAAYQALVQATLLLDAVDRRGTYAAAVPPNRRAYEVLRSKVAARLALHNILAAGQPAPGSTDLERVRKAEEADLEVRYDLDERFGSWRRIAEKNKTGNNAHSP